MNKCNADLGSRFVPQINTDIGELEALEGYCIGNIVLEILYCIGNIRVNSWFFRYKQRNLHTQSLALSN